MSALSSSPVCRRFVALGELASVLIMVLLASARASADTVLTFKYTPAARAQVAIWIEDAAGNYLATAALTEAVAFRGIGNRPGASQMNSGYRWPYGRREGVLPIWAHRRASARGAKLFPRLIFQARGEGIASRSVPDQSLDNYFCLQFAEEKSSRDELDAVSCATPFSSDKGRYLTQADVDNGYSEPWESMLAAPSGGAPTPQGRRQPLPLGSLYPARMDVTRCTNRDSGNCYDGAEVDRFAADVRAIMPEIDAITIATPPGDMPKSVLFSVPKEWKAGDYVVYIEVNLEGDYNDRWNAASFPTPKTPADDWDYYSLRYGYPYRGQPSLVWKVPFKLGPGAPESAAASLPAGRSSWEYWTGSYGQIEMMTSAAADPFQISSDQSGSGVNRLRADAAGQRFVVQLRDAGSTPVAEPPPAVDAGMPPEPPAAGSSGAAGEPAPMAGSGADGAAGMQPGEAGSGSAPPLADGPVGAVSELELSRHPNKLRSHTWVVLRLRAARSERPLHAYQVRVATVPIADERSFITQGREAKNATDAAEGATMLSLPTDVPEGEWIESAIGDLVADTQYYVGVRATDELNRSGPLSVATVHTSVREFQTVSPCFIASAAYGSPLASEVSVLRRARDRYLMPNAFGRALVSAYYTLGAPLARAIEPHPSLRAVARALIGPLVAAARSLR